MRTFQISKVFKDMTVLENMMVPLFQNQNMKEAKSCAEELLEFALLARLKRNRQESLGGAEYCFSIVRGFMNKNLRLYLLDEPFAGVHQVIKVHP